MLKTKYISNCTANDIDDLKTAILFFDQIDIIENFLVQVKLDKPAKHGLMTKGDTGVVTGVQNFITDSYKNNIDVLINEGWVSIISDTKKSDDKLWSKINTTVFSLLDGNSNLLFEESNVKKDLAGIKKSSTVKFSDEAKRIHNEFIGPLKIGSEVNLGFIFKYYTSLLSSLLFYISQGEQCLTTSDILNRLLSYLFSSVEFKILQEQLENDRLISTLATDAIKLTVPNLSAFPFDEVIEIRRKANDELLRFRSELETFQFNLLESYSYAEIQFKSKTIIKHKLNPSLVDLKHKIESLNLKVPKIVLNEFKDPKSYVPLLGSILGQLPAMIATLLSLGLISVSAAYEYVLGRKEIKNNGLYYLIHLNRKFGK